MKKAFTMAEAILVMTILGIIATIMITTLKPAEFKDKGLRILAKKVMSEIDTATTQILINNSQDGTMKLLLVPDTTTGATYSYSNTALVSKTAQLYKRYLTATRAATTGTYCEVSGSASFSLKDGACVAIKPGVAAYNTIFPGETNTTVVSNTTHPGKILGAIYVDTNGKDEPNVIGKDQFLFPVGTEGIIYEQ